jgi:YHS domain-containing protein
MNRIRHACAGAAIALTGLAFAAPAHADKDPVYTGTFSNTAVQGHDPVAYFTEGRPVKGSRDFATTYEGAEFRFASQENLDAFLADPARYAPQFGGYCAWAVSEGYTAKGDADHWAIVDDRLYLNYDKNVQTRWEQDRSGHINKANTNWPEVLD